MMLILFSLTWYGSFLLDMKEFHFAGNVRDFDLELFFSQ